MDELMNWSQQLPLATIVVAVVISGLLAIMAGVVGVKSAVAGFATLALSMIVLFWAISAVAWVPR